MTTHTLVIFTSDNGPWLSYGNHAGSAGAFREGKGTAFEGGVRVPFVARWPGRIPAGAVGNLPAMTIDVLPTLARLAGAAAPAPPAIDGRDIWPLLAHPRDAVAPHDVLYFYWGQNCTPCAAASGSCTCRIRTSRSNRPARTASRVWYVKKELELSLFDLDADAGESTNVAAQHPDVVASLQVHVERARADLGDSLTKRTGAHLRAAGAHRP